MALGVLVLAMLAYSGGAAAVVGDTDLALTKSDSPDPVMEGANLTYTIQVRNGGTGDATSVALADTLPSQLDFVSASAGCKGAGHKVTCDLGTVTAGNTATVTIVTKAKKSGVISNTATVTSPQDSTPANNSDTEPTTIIKPPKHPSCAAPTIAGTPGDDVLVGTPGPDVISSFGGGDRVYSGGGKDLVCTGAGADLVNGGGGGDVIKGGKGPDRLKGRKGDDLIKGKAGRDRLKGQAGNDRLIGGTGRDKCKGGKGHDVLKSCP